jgi:hypothetical protein
LIRDRADGCILTAELDRGVAEPTKRFLAKMREVVPHVLLVLTKMDKAFVDAVRRGGSEPWEQVEQARRIGTRRFAREIGRPVEGMLSIAVAAQAAIDEERSGLARRFQAEVAKLFQLLRQERALILGTRAAAVVRGCIAQTAAAEERAAAAYSERIESLEANRLPDPEAFRQSELSHCESSIDDGSVRALREAASAINDGFALLRTQCSQHFAGAKRLAGILDAAGSCERELAQGVPRVRAAGDEALEQAIDRVVCEIEVGLFERLRQQYQLIHDVRRSSSSLPRLDHAIEHVSPPTLALVPEVRNSVVTFTRVRWAFGALGIVLAAAIGTLVAPGLGTLAGAAVGPLLAFVRTRASLGRRAHALVEAALERQREHVLSDLQAQKPRIVSAIREALERSLQRVMVRFGSFIAEPLEAEQQAIDRERALLAELAEIRLALVNHDAQLGLRSQTAAEASIGLCR